VLVLAVLADKPWRKMAAALLPHCDAVVLTVAPSAPPERRWKLAEVETALRQSAAVPVRSIPDLSAALGRAATLAPFGTVVVSGSVYTVGDALRELGVAAE
jgi:dihydrofolate synthase/folylpolyglutamate synthase